jgi:hypothetical protein
MFLQRNPHPTFRGFGGGVLDSVIKGPYWAQWPDRIYYNLAHQITAPTAEGGTIGGLGKILNNMASMIKYMENMRREAHKSDAQGMDRIKRLGLRVSVDADGNATYHAL